jgi:DNA-binding HxlR family transcriptional regulator
MRRQVARPTSREPGPRGWIPDRLMTVGGGAGMVVAPPSSAGQLLVGQVPDLSARSKLALGETRGASAAAPGSDHTHPWMPTIDEDSPLASHVGALGRKWSLLILRDVASGQRTSFGRMLRAHPHLSRRMLSLRLRDLQREGYLQRITFDNGSRRTAYVLSAKGRDTIPVLNAISDLVRRHGTLGGSEGSDTPTVGRPVGR